MTDRKNMILKVGVIIRDDYTDDKSTMIDQNGRNLWCRMVSHDHNGLVYVCIICAIPIKMNSIYK